MTLLISVGENSAPHCRRLSMNGFSSGLRSSFAVPQLLLDVVAEELDA
jgi:hypothetical protein